ncbi:unnamed protein product [Moneuplotes crassus]|uniref:Uncharacterized protein n=1 Tax=Euplotes crassus TaxID=5936 RepID=A0AAD1UP31_EUPCR|nr:unnamed protein product [Moneuplotes crassus]
MKTDKIEDICQYKSPLKNSKSEFDQKMSIPVKNQTSLFNIFNMEKDLLNTPEMILKNKNKSLKPSNGLPNENSRVRRDYSNDMVNDYFEDTKGLAFFMKLRQKQTKTHKNQESSLRGSFAHSAAMGSSPSTRPATTHSYSLPKPIRSMREVYKNRKNNKGRRLMKNQWLK